MFLALKIGVKSSWSLTRASRTYNAGAWLCLWQTNNAGRKEEEEEAEFKEEEAVVPGEGQVGVEITFAGLDCTSVNTEATADSG